MSPSEESFICAKCKHYMYNKQGGCKAFPAFDENGEYIPGGGIPDEILMQGSHDKPLPDQKNDIIFEPIN